MDFPWGGVNGGWIIVAMVAIIVSFFLVALAAAGSVYMIISLGIGSISSMISYVKNINELLDISDENPSSQEQINASIK